MKLIFSVFAFLVTAFLSVNAWGSNEVQAMIKQVDGNTIVYCTPTGIDGGITKASIIIYESDGQKITVIRDRMELSIDNEATYVLPGTYLEVAGKCKLFTSYRNEIPSANPGTSINNGIAKADFYLSMK
jgi:hypothetical protein